MAPSDMAPDMARRPGRPSKTAAEPLGQLISTWLRAKQVSPQQFASRLGVSRTTLWRLLQGKTQYMLRTSVADLCEALQLTEAERTAFMRALLALEETHDGSCPTGTDAAYTAEPSHTPSPTTHQAADDKRQKRCKLAAAGPTEMTKPLAQQLDARGISSTALAHTLGIAPSTVTRALRHETHKTHALRPEHIARALRLDAVNRREFLSTALEAGLFAVTVPSLSVGHPAGPFAAFERRLGRSLADLEQEVIKLRERRNCGDVKAAYERACGLFAQLFTSDQVQARQLDASLELARMKLLVGFEYCEEQAAYLPWYDRETQMIETLNHIEIEVMQRFPATQFASEWGHLLNLRAPLYRQQPQGKSADDAYAQGIFEFDFALKHTISSREEPTLHIELLRNRAHTHLLHRDIGKWRADLETAQRLASTLRGEVGRQFEALVTYSWGEGHKRAAALEHLPPHVRAWHLRQALDDLREGEEAFVRFPLWHGYALLAAIAQAQCLSSIAPDEALRRLARLRVTAERTYPSLVAKIRRARAAVERK